VAGDAHHEDAKEQRRDDHLDEPQKDGSEELQVDCDRGGIVAKLRAGEKADEDPSRQRAAGCGIRRDEKDRKPAQERRDQRGQRQHMSAGEERSGNSDGGGDDCRGEEIFFIGAW